MTDIREILAHLSTPGLGREPLDPSDYHREEKNIVPPIDPFTSAEVYTARLKSLTPNRYGDLVWSNKKAILVIDASAPNENLTYLDESKIAEDVQVALSKLLAEPSLDARNFTQVLDGAIYAHNRATWISSPIDFGVSAGGMVIEDDQATIFNIGTGSVWVNDQRLWSPRNQFYMPAGRKSKAGRYHQPDMITIPLKEISSVVFSTDGIVSSASPPGSPYEQQIKPGANEATLVALKR